MTTVDEALAATRHASSYRVRYEWRDASFGLIADLTSAVTGGGISIDNDRQLPRSLSARLNADLLPAAFNVFRDFVGVTVSLLIDGEFVDFPFGLFKLDASKRTVRSNNRREYPVQGTDTLAVLAQARTPIPWTYSGGQNVVDEVTNICTTFGLVSRIAPSGLALATYTAWGPGARMLQIVDDLLDAINFFPASTDNEGAVISKERIDPALVQPHVSYSTTAPVLILDSDFTREVDTTDAPNQIVVLVDDPNRAAGYALRQNSDTRSPISTFNQGYATLEQINGDRVVSLDVAGDVAEYLLRAADGEAQLASIQTVLDPRRGPLESYRLTVDSEEIETLWRVKSWSVSLDRTPLVMNHRLARAQAITIDELLTL